MLEIIHSLKLTLLAMIESFLSKPEIFWIRLEALSVLAYTAIVLLTALFIYRQVRTATKVFQFDGIRNMQKMVDEFEKQRNTVLREFPLELIASDDQFPRRTPGKQKSYGNPKIKRPTKRQREALKNLTDEQKKTALTVINRLNDLGQLVEDRFIDRSVFWGKYHEQIIRLCYFLELIRQEEEGKRGGNYGQRLLRMRRSALTYNRICQKHRESDKKIFRCNEDGTEVKKIIVKKVTRASLFQKLIWELRRRWALY